jgi:hypothetical protein
MMKMMAALLLRLPWRTEMNPLADKPTKLKELAEKAKYMHLNDAELEAYAWNKITSPAQVRMEAHLKICLICSGRLEYLLLDVGTQPMHARAIAPEVLEPSLADLLISKLQAFFGNLSLQTVQLSFADAESSMEAPVREVRFSLGEQNWQVQTGDTDDADLYIRISYENLAYAGYPLRLSSDQWEGMEAVLNQVSAKEVAAEFYIPAEERKQIPDQTRLQANLQPPTANLQP